MNHSNLNESLATVMNGHSSSLKPSKINKLTRIAAVLQKKKDWKGSSAVSDDVIKVLRVFLVDRDRDVRGHAARVLKYITHNVETFGRICDTNIPFFMSWCLERDGSKYLMERVQCIKWIYQILKLMKMRNDDIDNHKYNQGDKDKQFKIEFPCCLTQSLIGIALSLDDELREICLNTLADLAIENIEIVSKYNGIKLMIDCILDTPLSKHTSQSLLCKMLHILDNPKGRKHLKHRSNIQQLFVPLVQQREVGIQVLYCFFYFYFYFLLFLYSFLLSFGGVITNYRNFVVVIMYFRF